MARQGIYDLCDKAALNLLALQATRIVQVSEALSAMTAGNTYTGTLLVGRILNSTKRWFGELDDSSFTPDGTIFKTEVATESEVDTNGDYYIDYFTGYYKVKAGGTGIATITYWISAPYQVGANASPFSAALTAVTTLTVTHNLGYIPQVWIVDASGKELACDIIHNTINDFTLNFAEAQTGTVYYR